MDPNRVRRASWIALRLSAIAAREAHQLLAAAASGDVQREDGAGAARVELVLDGPGLQRRPVARHEDAIEGSRRHLRALAEREHLPAVLGLAGAVLLAIPHPDPRARGHDHPRLRAIDARLPRARARADLAVLVLLRVLAEVPDVAVGVLRVPVLRVLDEPAGLGDAVVDDARDDPGGDALRPRRHRDHDAVGRAPAVALAVDPPVAGPHRPVRVVDRRREVG